MSAEALTTAGVPGGAPAPFRPRVVGLDLSLSSTGMSDGREHIVTQTTPDLPVEERLNRLVQRCVSFVLAEPEATLVVIEDAAFGRADRPGYPELAALRFMVRVRLHRAGVPFALVRPNTLKLYTTGRGNASKDEMVHAVDGRHGTHFADVAKSHGRYDLADARALAAMGYDWVNGSPSDFAREYLAKVDWPELVSDD